MVRSAAKSDEARRARVRRERVVVGKRREKMDMVGVGSKRLAAPELTSVKPGEVLRRDPTR
jgi:hypothetical protein